MSNRQHGIIKDKLYQTYLIAFHGSVTDLVNREVIYVDFCQLLPLSHISVSHERAMGYPPDDITAVGWKRSENLTPKLYLHGPLSGWNNVWSGFWALQYPILLLMSSKVGEKTFCKVSADSSKLEGTATAFEDSIVTHNDPDKMQKQSEKIRCNLR